MKTKLTIIDNKKTSLFYNIYTIVFGIVSFLISTYAYNNFSAKYFVSLYNRLAISFAVMVVFAIAILIIQLTKQKNLSDYLELLVTFFLVIVIKSPISFFTLILYGYDYDVYKIGLFGDPLDLFILFAVIIIISVIKFLQKKYQSLLLHIINILIYIPISIGVYSIGFTMDSVRRDSIPILQSILMKVSSGRELYSVIVVLSLVIFGSAPIWLLLSHNRFKKAVSVSIVEYSDNSKTDDVELLKKYKSLLDDDVITQEEFDAKKKELLNL